MSENYPKNTNEEVKPRNIEVQNDVKDDFDRIKSEVAQIEAELEEKEKFLNEEKDRLSKLKEEIKKAEIRNASWGATSDQYDFDGSGVVSMGDAQDKNSEADFEAYLNSRPSANETDQYKDKTADQYYFDKMDNGSDSNIEEIDSKINYGLLSVNQLVSEMADAEVLYGQNSASALKIQEMIGNRIDGMAEKEGWTSEQKDKYADDVLQRVIKLTETRMNSTPREVVDDRGKRRENIISEQQKDSVAGSNAGEAIKSETPGNNDGEGVINMEINIDEKNGMPSFIADYLEKNGDDEDDGEGPEGPNSGANDEEPETPDTKTEKPGEDTEKSKSLFSRAKDLYYKAGAMFSSYMFKVGNVFPKPEIKENESQEDFEKRVKRYGVAKLIGVVAIGAAIKYGLPHLIDSMDGNTLHTAVDNVYGHDVDVSVHNNVEMNQKPVFESGYSVHQAKFEADTNYLGQTDLHNSPDVGVTVTGGGVDNTPGMEFSSNAYTVKPGEGWYQVFTDIGIDKDSQATLLQKIGPKLHDMGWAYEMKDGTWGISRPGQLPKDVLEFINNNR